jgi:hypothetical protein
MKTFLVERRPVQNRTGRIFGSWLMVWGVLVLLMLLV